MADSKTAGKWNTSFSWLRSLACIAIVVLHVASYSMVSATAQGYELSSKQHAFASLLQYSCMWAVPVFVMVTGALLLDPDRELTWERLRKRYIGRIVKAIVCFGLLFIAFDLVMNGVEETANNSALFAAHPKVLVVGNTGSCLYVLLCTVGDLLTGHSWPHMWYLYMLLGLYLLMPFFRKIVAHSSERELQYLVLLLTVFSSLLPLLGLANVTTDYRFSVATVYPLYLLLGYVLKNNIVPMPRWAAWVCLLLSSVGIWLAVWFLHEDTVTISFLASYNSILVVLQAANVFSLFCGAGKKNTSASDGSGSSTGKPSAPRFLLLFDKCSFGIYLIHFVFVKLLLRYAHLQPFEELWLFPVIVLVIIAVSFVLTLVCYKVINCKALKFNYNFKL